MSIKEAIELCEQQIDSQGDDYAQAWKDIKATLEAVPVESIDGLVKYAHRVCVRCDRIEEWLNKQNL